jgi:hypothetical protein
MSDNFTVVLVVITIASGLVMIVRGLFDYRRSTTLVRAQADAHVKLMEKLASSQELLAYMETDAGKRFLQLVAVGVENAPSSTKFPFGRILWSTQAGLILLLAGVGFLFLRTRLHDPGASDGFLVLGTLGLTVGVGFILSAAASYGVSKHLGLIESETSARRA